MQGALVPVRVYASVPSRGDTTITGGNNTYRHGRKMVRWPGPDVYRIDRLGGEVHRGDNGRKITGSLIDVYA